MKLGRPPVLDPQKHKRIRNLRRSGHSIRYIAEQLDVSFGVVQREAAGH